MEPVPRAVADRVQGEEWAAAADAEEWAASQWGREEIASAPSVERAFLTQWASHVTRSNAPPVGWR